MKTTKYTHLIMPLIFLAAFCVFPLKKANAKRFYLIPKISFNYPIKGGDPSFGFGGGIGYWVRKFAAVETNYLRFISNEDNPNHHILEFNSILGNVGGKFSLLFQFGSGFYVPSDIGGMQWLFNFGAGVGLNFIPTLNLRISSVYYVFFKHKDPITLQLGLTMNM